jgi:hypothetical protein
MAFGTVSTSTADVAGAAPPLPPLRRFGCPRISRLGAAGRGRAQGLSSRYRSYIGNAPAAGGKASTKIYFFFGFLHVSGHSSGGPWLLTGIMYLNIYVYNNELITKKQ